MDSPTRGVDIGVKTTMYQLIARMKKEGYSILIIFRRDAGADRYV